MRDVGPVCVGGRVPGRASIEIRVRDAALAARLGEAVAASITRVLAQTPECEPPETVGIASLEEAGRAVGRIAIVRVACVPGRDLLALAEAIEAGMPAGAATPASADAGGTARAAASGTPGAAGIQLVWDGRPRSREAAVFRVLEAWRGRGRRCPLVLAPTAEPAGELLRAIALRSRSDAGAPGA